MQTLNPKVFPEAKAQTFRTPKSLRKCSRKGPWKNRCRNLLGEACPQYRCSNRLGPNRSRPISAKAGRGKGLGKIAVGTCWPKHAPSIGAATGLVKTEAGRYLQKLVGGKALEKSLSDLVGRKISRRCMCNTLMIISRG